MKSTSSALRFAPGTESDDVISRVKYVTAGNGHNMELAWHFKKPRTYFGKEICP